MAIFCCFYHCSHKINCQGSLTAAHPANLVLKTPFRFHFIPRLAIATFMLILILNTKLLVDNRLTAVSWRIRLFLPSKWRILQNLRRFRLIDIMLRQKCTRRFTICPVPFVEGRPLPEKKNEFHVCRSWLGTLVIWSVGTHL